MSIKNFSDCYLNRFSQKDRLRKNEMWEILCTLFIQRFIGKSDTVMDLGAGYCEFINNIKCRKKIAVDLNPDTKKSAAKGVIVVNKNIFDIPKQFNNSTDVVLLSNFLEHLNSKDEVLKTLAKVYKLLKPKGKIILLQPNINLVKEAYWDFIDHKVALNTKSIKEALEVTGFRISVFIEKFLPYTTKSGFLLPNSNMLLRLYLYLPQMIRPFAGQSFVVAVKNKE